MVLRDHSTQDVSSHRKSHQPVCKLSGCYCCLQQRFHFAKPGITALGSHDMKRRLAREVSAVGVVAPNLRHIHTTSHPVSTCRRATLWITHRHSDQCLIPGGKPGNIQLDRKNRFNCRYLSAASLPHLHVRRAAECYVASMTASLNSRMLRRRRGAVPGTGGNGSVVKGIRFHCWYYMHRYFRYLCLHFPGYGRLEEVAAGGTWVNTVIQALERLTFVF